MKYTNKILSLLFISMITIVSADINSDFLKVTNLIEENRIRFSNLQDTIKELGLQSENTNLKNLESELHVVLLRMSGFYGIIARILNETCVNNKAVYDKVANLTKLDINDADFFETSRSLMETQVGYLESAVNNTVLNMKEAHNRMDEAVKTTPRATESLNDIKQILLELGAEKKADLTRKISEAQQDANSKAGLEQMLNKTEKFMKDSEDYIEWYQKTSDNSNSLAKSDLNKIDGLRLTAQARESLIEETRKLIANKELEKRKKEVIIFYSNSISSTIGTLSDVCMDVMNRD